MHSPDHTNTTEAEDVKRDVNMAQDTGYKVYGGYRPYYWYGDYPGTGDAAEAAKTDMAKRDTMKAEMMKDEMMQTANSAMHEARDMMMKDAMMDKDMMDNTMMSEQGMMATTNMKRDMPALSEMAGTQNHAATLPDNWYGKYK